MHIVLSVLFFFSLFFCSGCHQARSSWLLYRLQQDSRQREEDLRRETANFNKAREALFSLEGWLQPLCPEEARKVFGEPVIVLERGSKTVWAYKPGEAGWFSGEKVFLTFERGRLSHAEYRPS